MQNRTTQTDIVEKAGINPKTLLSSVLYWQKLDSGISTALALPYLAILVVAVLSEPSKSGTVAPSWENWLIVLAGVGLVLGLFFNAWVIYAVPKIYAWRVRVFAQKNNLHLLPQSKLVGFIPPSVNRADVHNVQAVGCALPVAGQKVTVFDYTCVVGSGKHKEYMARGLAALQLKGDYPHLYLDSKKNGKNHQYAANQRVELEGDFAKYFDVYMPEGSQAGSLTVFAPDMMQTILDTGKLFDVEIQGNQAVIISNELTFTRRVLPSVLSCAAGLSKEFKELDRTWKPVFAPGNKKYTLRGQSVWRIVLIALAPLIIGQILYFAPHPIKNKPAPVIVTPESAFSIDYYTLTTATKIANQLNNYTAHYPVPDSLAQARIENRLDTINYTKLTPDIYQFCATYHMYINGNGPTGDSGNIVAYYGQTVNSPDLPTTLQIVEWHAEGKNCQVIKPVPVPAS